MESVYIETSVVSYLVARTSHEPVTAWRQQLTRQWWQNGRPRYGGTGFSLLPSSLRSGATGREQFAHA